MTAPLLIPHRSGLLRTIVGSNGARTRPRPGAPFRSAGTCSAYRLSVTPPCEGQPFLGVSSPDLPAASDGAAGPLFLRDRLCLPAFDRAPAFNTASDLVSSPATYVRTPSVEDQSTTGDCSSADNFCPETDNAERG